MTLVKRPSPWLRQRIGGFSYVIDLGRLAADVAVGGDQVETAVEVQVGQDRAPAGQGAAVDRQARLVGLVLIKDPALRAGEAAPEGLVLAEEVGDHDVGQTVAVGVAESDPHVGLGQTLAVDRHAELLGDVLEGAVAAVPPESVALCVVGDEPVDPAVAVEVGGQHAHAAPDPATPAAAVTSVKRPSPSLR